MKIKKKTIKKKPASKKSTIKTFATKKKAEIKKVASSTKKKVVKKSSTPKKKVVSSSKKVKKDDSLNKLSTVKKPTTKSSTKKIVGKKKTAIVKQKDENIKNISKKNKIIKKQNLDLITDNKIDKEDLIITREIDLSDLNSYIEAENKEAEYLADTAIINIQEIQKALEESEEKNKNVLDENENYNFLIGVDNSKDKSRIPSKVLVLVFLIVILLIFLFTFVKVFVDSSGNKISAGNMIINLKKEQEEEKRRKELEEKQKKQYDECYNEQYNSSDTSSEIEEFLNNFNSYLDSKYKATILYEDINRGFSYKYAEEKKYYAASTIKALDALYIYSKASAGEINLDDTLTYTSAFRWTSSKYMQTHKIGDKIAIRDLVKYAILVSDNAAHQMLVSYVGRNVLKEYGKSLGAELTLSGVDNFGYINANDGYVYARNLYDFFRNNGDLGSELKSYFIESEQNDLKLEGIDAATKYGEYSEFYHNIGIVFADNPYILVVLTREGKKNYESIIQDISSKIYELHQLYYANREKVCKEKIYGN